MVISSTLLILITVTVASAQQFLAGQHHQASLPLAQYRHEIFYPTAPAQHGQFLAASDASEDGILAATAQNHQRILLSGGARALPLSTSAHQFVAGSFYRPRPLLASVDLFTPNTVQQPAETPGQIENYRKALEEEARDAEKAENDIINNGGPSYAISNADGSAKSFVNVKIHGQNQYGYSV